MKPRRRWWMPRIRCVLIPRQSAETWTSRSTWFEADLLPHGKPAHVLHRRFGFIHAADFRPARAFPQQSGELGELFGFADRVDFHAAIIGVSHPARQAQRTGRVLHEVAEAHALHAPAHAIEAGFFLRRHYFLISG